MKKVLSVILLLCLAAALLPCSACAEIEMREFTDDTGRTVTIPNAVGSIAVSGPLAQIYVLPIASDLMAGSANDFSVDAQKYLKPAVLALPPLGQLYGGRGTMDLEALLRADPDVVIDVGEAKGNIAGDLDLLSEQCAIPFIHIDASVVTAPDAYRRLGQLLGREDRAEELAVYLENIFAEVSSVMEEVDADGARKTALYCLGDKGLNVLAEKSFHSETMNFVVDNAAKLDEVVSSGAGNEVDLEQLLLWNPEVIIFAPDSIYSQVGSDPTWQLLDAIKSGSYYKTPAGPYGWLQSPPAVQRYLGLMWLTSLLYPDYCSFDLQEKVTGYYSLFYGYDLTDADYAELTSDALPKA